jgi:hypothetical protein
VTQDPKPTKRWPMFLAAAFLVGFVAFWGYRVAKNVRQIKSDRRSELCRAQLQNVHNFEQWHFNEHNTFTQFPWDLKHNTFTQFPWDLNFSPYDATGKQAPAFVFGLDGGWAPGPMEQRMIGALSGYDEAQVQRAVEVLSARGTNIGITGSCPSCSITIVCFAQLDDDDTLDAWSVSSIDRSRDGQSVRAGEVMHEIDDVVE